MNEEIPQIEYKDDNEGFKNFLNTPDNKRIFFSGFFGIGKTVFLKKFFSQNSDEYETFHLFPVKYQINNNENIIDLFKYDIVIELCKKDNNIFETKTFNNISDWVLMFSSFLKEKFTLNNTLQSFISKGGDLLSLSPDPISQTFNHLGKPLIELLKFDEALQKFKKDYKSFEQGMTSKFINENKKIFEKSNDVIGCLLAEKIKKLKGDKKSVLILDDFDRIDPEHIFRILNILSSSGVEDQDPNLLDFDCVIVVGDKANIESIFKHRYGENTDFNGYFNKFFTTSTFIFDNRKVVSENISIILNNIKCSENIKFSLANSDGITYGILYEILMRANDLEKINLRQLYKPVNYNFPAANAEIASGYNERKQYVDIGIELLIAIFDGRKPLLSLLTDVENLKTAEDYKSVNYLEYINVMSDAFIGEKTSFIGVGDARTLLKKNPLLCKMLIKYIKESKYKVRKY